MKKILFPLLALALIFSCSSEDDSNDSGNSCDSTIPFLQKGMTYNYAINGSNNSVIAIGDCSENGFEVTRTSPIGNGVDIWRQNGEFLEVDSNGNIDYWAKTYKLNASLGDSWTHTQPDGDIVTHTVISVDSTITVPAGTFTCKVFSYENTGTINTSYTFWDDTIGQIKEDAGFFVIELVSHELVLD